MRRLRFIVGALPAVLWIAPLHAQQPTGTIRGRVTDAASQQPLAGATVSFGVHRALSQGDGRYIITGVMAGTDTVRARLIGYARGVQGITIGGGDTMTVDLALTAQAVNLSEIVVTGYGTQRAGNITGAVTQVSSEDFNTGRIVSPQQLIDSKVAGVQIVPNNEPGGGVTLRIRGANSATASSDPLYVVDGMPLNLGNTNPTISGTPVVDASAGLSSGRDPLNFINPDDIESITILRDASAAAIYGVNSANGIVIITTKAGRHGAQIEYTGSTSASSITRIPSMLDAAQFQTAVQTYAPGNVGQLSNANTDWFGLVDRTAFGQEHNVSVSGIGTSNTYRVSLGYLNQDGVIQGTTAERISLGLNYTQRLFNDRLGVRANVRGARLFDQFTPGGVLSNAAQMGPTQPVYDPNAPTGYYNWPGNTLQSADNPLQILNLAKNQATTYRSTGNAQAEYSVPFIQGLKGTINLGYDIAKVTQETFNPSVLHQEIKSGENGYDYRADNTLLNTILETYFNYATPLSGLPGNIDLTGGYSYAQAHGEYPSLTMTGLSTNLLGTNGVAPAQNVTNFLFVEESKLISFFGRLNYNIGDRYLAAVSFRRDGSSKFGPGHQWGSFPAVSFGWRLSQEPFMQNFTSISDLKLRASWAKTGNSSFANYQQYAAFQPSNTGAQVQFGNTFVPTLRPAAVDPDIRWEATSGYDVGLDYGLFGQRVTGSIDWYTKKTTDMIFFTPIAAGTNFSNFLTHNIGSMRNRGIEFSVSARVLDRTDGLRWTADFTAAHNSNELLAINPVAGAVQQILVGGVAGGVGTTIEVLEPGQPVFSFFVCQQAYQNGKPVENNYVNQADGTIVTGCSNTNRRAFHDPTPHWILGHTSHMTYRQFDLSFTLRAWLGNYVYNNVASNLGTYQELNRASPYNLNASVLQTGFMTPQYLSDYYVENGSFLRMDNITLNYNFTYGGRQMRLFGTVQHAFTITGYSGVDPTAGVNGIDNNIYPASRTFSAGLNVRL
jgi:TonB-dependent starch-binding outer membrane protein SusC